MDAAGVCGYHVVPVQEILMAGRTKHQELLCNTLSSRLQAQVLSEAFWLQPVGAILNNRSLPD